MNAQVHLEEREYIIVTDNNKWVINKWLYGGCHNISTYAKS